MEALKIKILRSALFTPYPNVRCGMSTRRGGVSPEPYELNMSLKVGDKEEHVLKNRELFFRQMGIPSERLAIPNQVHGSDIVRVSEPGIYEACDGLITSMEDVFLIVTVADCVPVFIYDPVVKAVAAVHAGWRGSKLKILKNAVQSMVREFSSEPKNILAYIGPSAGVCCYEIGHEIAEQFEDGYILHHSGRNPHLDMRAMQMDLLLEMGIFEKHIEVSHYCTVCSPNLFHSYRRLGPYSGRMMGVIGMTRECANNH
jgi:purine-nucleoside/S-methyl-5'-thioadenosine phosphorylase / adenosine deaminase